MSDKRGRGKRVLPASRSREVGYFFDVVPEERYFNERPMEELLQKALKVKVISEFDTGRGHCVWFNGRPGPALRALRDEVIKIAESAGGKAVSRARRV